LDGLFVFFFFHNSFLKKEEKLENPTILDSSLVFFTSKKRRVVLGFFTFLDNVVKLLRIQKLETFQKKFLILAVYFG
jgi:hypothetical protein